MVVRRHGVGCPPMRAPLFLLTTTTFALAAVSAACFDWDGLIGHCQDAGNCLPPGGADSGDGGDGGDGGGVGDAGQAGGGYCVLLPDAGLPDAGLPDAVLPDAGSGGLSRGQSCTGSSQCVTGLCSG